MSTVNTFDMYTGDLQIVALTAYANAYLNDKKVSFDKSHPAGYGYKNIKFVSKVAQLEPVAQRVLLAQNPNDWFKFLKKNNVSRLFLTYQMPENMFSKDHLEATKGKKVGKWNVIAKKQNSYDLWTNYTQAEYGDAINYYHLILKDTSFDLLKFPSLKTTKLYLNEILTDLISFTKENKLKNWTSVFQKALEILSIEDVSKLVDENYFPADCFGLEAKQVMATIDHAWVFGGMGSFTDVSQVNDYDLYRRLSANLYNTLCNALAAVTNSYPAED